MKVKINKLTIHHFLSFGDAEIALNDRGYCLVSGINNNPKDAAKSNGSGKSTIWSALSYVLTGKTVQGTTSELPNNFYKDGCWVSLSLDVDGHEFIITRSKDDKTLGTNLKVVMDGVDKSGKGIQESQKILSDLLPDLNEELIGSIIILGQGMPDKFTKNTPAKRKEILEHLSKSDFMIEDLKNRVNNRLDVLSKQVREVEDSSLTNNTQKGIYTQQLGGAKVELDNLCNSIVGIDFDALLKELNDKLETLNKEIEEIEGNVTKLNLDVEENNNALIGATNEKQGALNKVRDSHDSYVNEYNEKKTKLSSEIYVLKTEIEKLKAITDVCPTCGQKIPNVSKPDTSDKEKELSILNSSLEELNKEISLDSQEYREVLEEINNTFDANIKALQEKIASIKESIRQLNVKLYEDNRVKIELTQNITINKTKKDTYLDNKKRIEDNIKDLEEKIQKALDALEELNKRGSNLKLHQDVVNKMNTYIKRDFRGYLLQNVITYIETKAKEYSAQIFDTNEIRFALDGNNIEISFCDKSYENLSGGEKQRVDLIVQFAIRDMMCQYLDFSCNILVLDEITDALDSVSCDRVLNFITKELTSVESVFIISHHANELDIACDSEIVVMKDANGVSEITSQY